VEVSGIELPIWPVSLPRLLSWVIVGWTESDIRARRARPVLEVRKRLLKEGEIARVEFGQHALTESLVRNDLTEILICPLREGASRFQIVPHVGPEIRITRLQVLETALAGVWKTGVDEDIARYRVRAERADGGQEWPRAAMPDEDETAILRQWLQPSRYRCRVLDPVGHVTAALVHEDREDCVDTALPQLAGDWCPGQRTDKRAVEKNDDWLHA